MCKRAALAVVLSIVMILQMASPMTYADEVSATDKLSEDEAVDRDIPVEEGDVLGIASMSQSEYDSKMNSFINDNRWKNGASYSSSQSPKLSTWSSIGCFAYGCDFSKYMFGINRFQDGESFGDASQIRAGDVIIIKPQHVFCVLKRDGDTLYTADGATGNNHTVAHVGTDRFYLSNGGLKTTWGEAITFAEGYHLVNLSSEEYEEAWVSITNISNGDAFSDWFEIQAWRRGSVDSHYAEVYIDGNVVSGHLSADSNGYFSYWLNPADYSWGEHEIKVNYVNPWGSDYAVRKVTFYEAAWVSITNINEGDTLSGWFEIQAKRKGYVDNHYAVIYIDEKDISGHISADSDGLFRYLVNTANYTSGAHEIKIEYVNTWESDRSVRNVTFDNLPWVQIKNLSDGDTIRGAINVGAWRRDKDSNHYAIFSIDGQDVTGHLSADGGNYFYYNWDTTKYSNGSHTIKIIYYNTSGSDVSERTVMIQNDIENPVIKDVKIENLTMRGYDISCVVTDNIGVTSVNFESWTVNNGEDDIVVCEGTFDKDKNRWYGHVNISDHNGGIGNYKNRIIAYDACQNIGKLLQDVYVGDGGKDSSSSSGKGGSSTSNKDGFSSSSSTSSSSSRKNTSSSSSSGSTGSSSVKSSSSSSGKSGSSSSDNKSHSSSSSKGKDETTSATDLEIIVKEPLVTSQKIDVSSELFKDVLGEKTYWVSNKKIASVNKHGLLKAKKPGVVVVYAKRKDNGGVAHAEIEIVSKPRLKFGSSYGSNDIGKTIDAYKAIIGSDKLPAVAYWETSNPSVATIDKTEGVIRIMGAGKTRITAYYGRYGIKGGMVKVSGTLRVNK